MCHKLRLSLRRRQPRGGSPVDVPLSTTWLEGVGTVYLDPDKGNRPTTIVRSKVNDCAGTPARWRCSHMRKTALLAILFLAAAATAVAFDRVVVCEDAYAEY
jgi:hypothetical protein